MSIPTLITITGTVRDKTGPLAGYLVFASQTLVRDDASNDVMVPQEIIVSVGADGELSAAIPATNDPGFSPSGWTWEVRPHFPGWRTPFSVAVPYDAPGGTLNLSDLAPVPPDGTAALYALYNHTHAGGGGGSVSPATTVTDETTYAVAKAVGASALYARGDHTHGTPTAPTAASVGAATTAHTHTGVYDPAGTSTAAIAAHVAAGDPHPVYLTQAEGDALYAAIGGGGGSADGRSTMDLSFWGFKAASDNPLAFMSQGPIVNGQQFTTAVWVPAGVAITNVYAAITTAGVYDGSTTENRLGVYEANGTKVGQTADLGNAWQTTGWRGGAIAGGPIASQGTGRFVWVGVVVRGYTSSPSFAYPASPSDFAHQIIGPGQTRRRTFYSGGQTALLASIDPATTGTATGYATAIGIS
jgi:hypothetical protein